VKPIEKEYDLFDGEGCVRAEMERWGC